MNTGDGRPMRITFWQRLSAFARGDLVSVGTAEEMVLSKARNISKDYDQKIEELLNEVRSLQKAKRSLHDEVERLLAIEDVAKAQKDGDSEAVALVRGLKADIQKRDHRIANQRKDLRRLHEKVAEESSRKYEAYAALDKLKSKLASKGIPIDE